MAENGLDLGNLNAKLDWQNQDYWLHIDADTKLDKYPGEYGLGESFNIRHADFR
jgi:hypothetical protein